MANKTTRKKRAFKEMCRLKAKEGFVNNALGQWYKPAANDRMGDMLLAGYRVK
jgi:hypothetical protein